MAAGRHGGGIDYEFRGRKTGFLKSMKDIDHSNGVYDRIQKISREGDRGRDGDNRVRDREMKHSEFQSASRWRVSGHRTGGCGLEAKLMDLEPGELFADGLDRLGDMETQLNKGTEVKMSESRGQLSPSQNKKRKISPSICDNLPSSPPLVSLHHESMAHNLELSPYKIDEVPSLLEFPAETSPHVPEGPRANEVSEEIENYGYVPARSIISSRWANDDGSPPDAGEVSDSEEIQKLKRKLAYESAAVREHMKLITPENQEVRRNGSKGTRGRSCESDKHVVRSSSRDDHDKDENSDYMEIDDDHNYDGNGSLSGTESEDDQGSKGTPDSAFSPTRRVNMLQGCRNVDEFERLNKISEGTYGVVYRAMDKKTGEIVALKKVKMEKEREGFPLTSLREINILLSLRHPSIVDVKEVVVGNSLDSIFMVMEYMEHDLKGLMETMKQPFSQSEVKCLMLQLLEGMSFLHDNWVLHRDLKTSNLLLNNCGELKICDLGLSRQYGSPLKPYTPLVVTLWYRAPELLLGAKQYFTAIDMWSLGCIMAELLSREPLFNGKTEVDQLDKIFKILGTPNETIWPGLSNLPGAKVNFVKHKYNLLRKKFPATSFTGSPVLSDAGFDLLNSLLTYDPEKRITAEVALNHAWFREVPLPKSKEFMPTFPAQHAQDRQIRRV